MVPGRDCAIPVAAVDKMVQKFKPKPATLQFRLCNRGDERQKKPRLLLTSSWWCWVEIAQLAKPVLVGNPWNRKDFSPSGRLWPQFRAGLIRIGLNLVRCDSWGTLEVGLEFEFVETRNVFCFGGKISGLLFGFFSSIEVQSDFGQQNTVRHNFIDVQLEPGRGRAIPDPRAGEGCSHHSWERAISTLSARLFLEV